MIAEAFHSAILPRHFQTYPFGEFSLAISLVLVCSLPLSLANLDGNIE